MSSFDCWCLAPESTLRHLWTTQIVRRRSVVGSGSFCRLSCREGCACAVRARRRCAMLMHTVSLGAGVLRALLERAKLLFSIVDMMSVNGAAFRQVRVACETLTGVFLAEPKAKERMEMKKNRGCDTLLLREERKSPLKTTNHQKRQTKTPAAYFFSGWLTFTHDLCSPSPPDMSLSQDFEAHFCHRCGALPSPTSRALKPTDDGEGGGRRGRGVGSERRRVASSEWGRQPFRGEDLEGA
eukprot:scaffold4121_cov104-Isochrysis_galbana.AAC.1